MDITKVTRTARKLLKLQYCGAVIVAAGNASRMEGIDKVMAPIGGQPMIRRTVEQFQNCDAIGEIVVVTRQDLLETVSELCRDFPKVQAVVVGGDCREASVVNGLEALSKKCTLAAIHDGARPFATWEMIDRVVRAAHTYGAAVPVIPVKDTIKVVQGGLVHSTPPRRDLRAVQTPQVFDYDLLRAALQKVAKEKVEITDDCSAMEHFGMTVKTVEGDERNIKVTTPMDLKIAELLLEEMA